MSNTLLISEIFPPTHGGSGRWFWELYSRLPHDEYLIIAGKTPQTNEFDNTHDLNVKRINLSSDSWGIASLTGLAFYWKTFWLLKKAIKENNITAIHCGRCLPEGVMGLLLSLFTGIPFLCYIHGEDVETASTSRELSWLVGNVLKKAKTLVSNSQNTANILIERWQADKETIAILNPGCDTTKFVPANTDVNIRHSLGWGSRNVILTVGRLQERKGQDMMIKALPKIKEKHPTILYAIVGDGEEKPRLEALIYELNLTNNVIFHSEISDTEMIQCYQQCDVFILPNRTVGNDIEGFGMVLVEAQACAKLVVAGDSGGTAETMLIGESGYVIDCTKPDAIQKTMNTLFNTPELISSMGLIGREHVVNTLDWQAHTAKAKALFSSMHQTT